MKHPSPVSYTHSPVPPLPQHTRSLVSSALSLLILITCGIQAELDSLHLIDFPRRCKKEEGADWGWHGCALSLPCSGSALAAGHSAPSHPLHAQCLPGVRGWVGGAGSAARSSQGSVLFVAFCWLSAVSGLPSRAAAMDEVQRSALAPFCAQVRGWAFGVCHYHRCEGPRAVPLLPCAGHTRSWVNTHVCVHKACARRGLGRSEGSESSRRAEVMDIWQRSATGLLLPTAFPVSCLSRTINFSNSLKQSFLRALPCPAFLQRVAVLGGGSGVPLLGQGRLLRGKQAREKSKACFQPCGLKYVGNVVKPQKL